MIDCLLDHDTLWLHVIMRKTWMDSCFVLTNNGLLLYTNCLLIWEKCLWMASPYIIIVYFESQACWMSSTNNASISLVDTFHIVCVRLFPLLAHTHTHTHTHCVCKISVSWDTHFKWSVAEIKHQYLFVHIISKRDLILLMPFGESS